jgi:hypothetical protein
MSEGFVSGIKKVILGGGKLLIALIILVTGSALGKVLSQGATLAEFIIIGIYASLVWGSAWGMRKITPNQPRQYHWIVGMRFPLILVTIWGAVAGIMTLWGFILTPVIWLWYAIHPRLASTIASILYLAYCVIYALSISMNAFGDLTRVGKVSALIALALNIVSIALLLYHTYYLWKQHKQAPEKLSIARIKKSLPFASTVLGIFTLVISIIAIAKGHDFSDTAYNQNDLIAVLAIMGGCAIVVLISVCTFTIQHKGLQRMAYILFFVGFVVGTYLFVEQEYRMSPNDYFEAALCGLIGGLSAMGLLSVSVHLYRWVRQGFLDEASENSTTTT